MADLQLSDHPPAPWDTLWTGALIAGFDPALGDGPYGLIEKGAVAAKDGRIAWIGRVADLPGRPADLADAAFGVEGMTITPGLIDCHTHLVYGGNRAGEFEQRLNGVSYAEIAAAGGGIASTVRATREADEEVLFAAAEKRLHRLIADGVTTVEIKSGYGLDLETELKMLRVARRLELMHPVTVRTSYLGAHAVPPGGDRASYLDFLCAEALPAVAESGLADAVDGFCETIAFSAAEMARVFDVATGLGLPVKLHADQLTDGGGAALAARYDALSADHIEYASAEGIGAMAASGTVGVLLPGAYYVLKETQKPPVELMRKAGVPMAVATDCNPGSSPISSLLLTLNMACTFFGLTPAEALAGATREAARALGMAETHGTLSVGKAADLAIWDVGHPAELVYEIGATRLSASIKEGRVALD